MTGITEIAEIKNFYASIDGNYLKIVSREEGVNSEISIIGMNGQVADQFENNNSNNIHDISRLSSGLYIVRILDKSNNRLESYKIVKTQ